MIKTIYFFFLIVVATGLGCAITNYALITDNDQVSNGQGSGIVNTNGKAKLTWSFQAATIWPDGRDELFSMVDQKANGDRTITTYNNFSTGDAPTYHSDLYCNPDWSGCAIFTAPDPEIGDDDIFDGKWNTSCFGARSLGMSVSTGRYYGECGRAKVDLADRIALMNMGRIATKFGSDGLLYDLDRSNFSIVVDNNAGVASRLPIRGEFQVFMSADGGRQRTVLDATNPLAADLGRSFADFLRNYGTNHVTATLTYNGIQTSFEIGGDRMTAANVLAFVNRKY